MLIRVRRSYIMILDKPMKFNKLDSYKIDSARPSDEFLKGLNQAKSIDKKSHDLKMDFSWVKEYLK